MLIEFTDGTTAHLPDGYDTYVAPNGVGYPALGGAPLPEGHYVTSTTDDVQTCWRRMPNGKYAPFCSQRRNGSASGSA